MTKNKIELKPILIVSATKADTAKDTRLVNSLNAISDQVKLKILTNNESGLPKIYNKFFTKKIAHMNCLKHFFNDLLGYLYNHKNQIAPPY